MNQEIKDYLLQEIQKNQKTYSLVNIFKQYSIDEITDELTNILLNEKGDISALAAIHIVEILDHVELNSQKFEYERVFIKMITNYKDSDKEDQHIVAQTIAALLKKYNQHLSISDQTLLTMIISQKKYKIIKGLFLLKEITSYKQYYEPNQERQKNNSPKKITDPQYLFQQAGQPNIYGVSDVINSLIVQWDKKFEKQQQATKNEKQQYECNQLIGICLIQLQNHMNQKQKQKAFPLLFQLLEVSKLIEDDCDLLFNLLNFLKSYDNNFFIQHESAVFKKLSVLLRFYKLEDFLQTQEERKEQRQTEQNKQFSVQLGVYIFEQTVERSINKKCKFLSEMIEFMFSMCELDNIDQDELCSQQLQNQNAQNFHPGMKILNPQDLQLEQAFTDFQYQLETINQSQKKILMNDQIFNKIINNFKKIGKGKLNNENKQVSYDQDDCRILIGCYNMLFYQTKFNVDPIRAILNNIIKYIGQHLQNPYIFCYAVRFLYQIAASAINYITPFHQSYMKIIIDNVCDLQSQSREQITGISFIERVLSKISYEEDFALFEYIPRIYEFCLREYSKPNFTIFQSLYQELVQNLINSILHKTKIEYYIGSYIESSKEIFLSYAEKKQNNIQSNINQQNQNQTETSHSTSHLSCLSSLAKMVMKSKHCKDEDLVNRVKALLREYANEIYQGKFDNFLTSRTEIYQFMYSISIEFLNDQNLIDELFLKMYSHIIKDCQIQTNVRLILRNQEQPDDDNEINGLNPPNAQQLLNNFANANQINQANLQVNIQAIAQNAPQVQQAIAQQVGQLINNIQNNQNLMNVQQNLNNNLQAQAQNNNPEMDEEDQQNNSEDFVSINSDEEIIQENFVNQEINVNLQNQEIEEEQEELEEQEEEQEEDQEEDAQPEDFEQVYFEQPNPINVSLKCNALYLLGEFISESPQIVMEYKKFEIVKVLMETSKNDKEETSITFMNYQTLGQMFKCVQLYFKKYYPHLYFVSNVENPNTDGTLTEEAKTEYNPIVDIFLNQIENLDQLNEDNIHEELLYKLSYVLRNLDGATKRAYFDKIFNTIRNNVIKTLHLYQSGLIDKQMECLQLLYKSSPDKIQLNFVKVWNIIVKNFFQDINVNEQEEDKQNNKMQDENKSDSEEEIELDEQNNNQQTNKLNLTKDLSIIHSSIGYSAHFIKYDKSVYPIVSKTVNKVILDKLILEDEILLRNCIYYLNVVTRYCYDIIEPATFKKLYQILKQIVISKKLDDFDEKGTVENVYTTFALMTTKLMENPSQGDKESKDMLPFNKLYSIIPFEDDFPEMKRVITISEFLLKQNNPIIHKNINKIVLCLIQIINEPARYRVKQKNEHEFSTLYEKLLNKYPEVSTIALNHIQINKNNEFKEKDQLLKKLKLN